MTDARRGAPSMGLAEAVRDVIDILRGRPASAGAGPDNWEPIVRIIAEHGSLPDGEVGKVKVIEKAIEATHGCGSSGARWNR
ncbi:MAG TPA: hypothetical protein VMN39_04020 [Longimicrobiaceae bacterium]|nr:hypothetical protein [Longimicrobiaceae bacterium]